MYQAAGHCRIRNRITRGYPTKVKLGSYEAHNVRGKDHVMVEKKTVYRDSRDGQFITKRESDRRPETTEKERVRVVPPGKAEKDK